MFKVKDSNLYELREHIERFLRINKKEITILDRSVATVKKY